MFYFFIIRFFDICLHHLNSASVLLLKRERTNVDNIVINAFVTQVAAKLFDVEIVIKKSLKNTVHWYNCLVYQSK